MNTKDVGSVHSQNIHNINTLAIGIHPSHATYYSDGPASCRHSICSKCLQTNKKPGGLGGLSEPCRYVPEDVLYLVT